MQPVQLKMARAALDLSVDQLAAAAGVSHVDVGRCESGESAGEQIGGRLRAVFEQAGIEFLGEDGVRCAVQPAPATVPLEELNSANDE